MARLALTHPASPIRVGSSFVCRLRQAGLVRPDTAALGARSAEMIDFIYDQQGHNIGWMKSGRVFSNADQMVGTVRDGQLYTLEGEPTGLFLGQAGVRSTAETQAKLKRLFEDSYVPS